MHDIQKKVLNIFLKNPGHEYGTRHLVKNVFPKEFEFIKQCMQNPSQDKDTIKLGKRKKAKLHRKLLYHLNKLQEENVLIMSQTKGKGEKFYILNPERDTLSKKDKELKKLMMQFGTGKRDFFKITGLERYKDLGIIKKYDETHWSNRVNSILIETDDDIQTKVQRFLPCVNDALGLHNFQNALKKTRGTKLLKLLRSIYTTSKDYNKYVNLLLDIEKIEDKEALTEFLILHCEEEPTNTFIILQSDLASIESQEKLNTIINYLSTKNMRVNFQNKAQQTQPFIIGNLGTYTIRQTDWKNYQENNTTLGLVFSETSIYVDMKRLEQKIGLKEFHAFCKKITKSFILATTDRRKNSYAYFKPVLDYEKKTPNTFFNYSYNHIKLWNYDSNNKLLLDVLSNVQEELELMSVSQETVFKSCGLPIRFKTCISSAFNSFDEEFLSSKRYDKFKIRNIKELSTTKVKERLKTREKYFKIFKQGDRVRIYREHNFEDFDIVKELKHLQKYHLPLITIDFRNKDRIINLQEFIS